MTRAMSPHTLSEALELLGGAPDAVAVAGCTDLMVVDHARRRTHGAVIDVHAIPEIRDIREEGGWIGVGAACTFSEIQRDGAVLRSLPILVEVAKTIGSWQIQNRATLGGNIANASPAGDSLPVLLALGAEVELASSQGARRFPYETMHVSYRATCLQPGELITRVWIPVPKSDVVQQFDKVGTRAAQAISKVVVASCVKMEQGRITQARFAAGSVAAIPVRLTRTESLLIGERPDAGPADAAGAMAGGEVTPIDDVRSTAEYRAYVLGRVVRRMVLRLGAGAEGSRA